MKYILDDDGYIEELIFATGAQIGRDGVACTEYTGSIPSGFTSLEEWAQLVNVRAWRLVDGDLSFNPVRLAELEAAANEEETMYRPATMEDLYKAVSVYTDNSQQSYSQYVSGNTYLTMEGSGGFAIPQFVITSISLWKDDSGKWNEDSTNWNTVESYFPSKLEIVTSTKNLLPIDFDKYIQSGLTITREYDGGLSIYGTTAENKEIVLCGNTDMIAYLNAGVSYYKSGLESFEIKLYDVNGDGAILIHQGGNGVFTPTEDYRVSKIGIVIPSGTYDTTIYPQLEIGNAATSFEINKRDYLDLDTNNNIKLTLLNGELRLDGALISYSNSLRSYKHFMVNCTATSIVQYVLSETDGDITRVKIKADQIDLAGYTTIVNHDEYSNTKVEFLPNNDLETVMKVSVQHTIDGDNAPFVQKFTIDKTGEVHLTGTLYIDSGAFDAIEITDASGSAIINSSGIHSL
ncbi:MAG: hypothetical protein MJZ37_06245 [Bacilli bacterium]|nr:hypothetical protein [Bacilli bacterium]